MCFRELPLKPVLFGVLVVLGDGGVAKPLRPGETGERIVVRSSSRFQLRQLRGELVDLAFKTLDRSALVEKAWVGLKPKIRRLDLDVRFAASVEARCCHPQREVEASECPCQHEGEEQDSYDPTRQSTNVEPFLFVVPDTQGFPSFPLHVAVKARLTDTMNGLVEPPPLACLLLSTMFGAFAPFAVNE